MAQNGLNWLELKPAHREWTIPVNTSLGIFHLESSVDRLEFKPSQAGWVWECVALNGLNRLEFKPIRLYLEMYMATIEGTTFTSKGMTQ